ILWLGLLWQCWRLVTITPAMYLEGWAGGFFKDYGSTLLYVQGGPGTLLKPYFGASVLATALACGLLTNSRWPRVAMMLGLVAVHFYLGRWTLLHSPNPTIDVIPFHRDSIQAFLNGINPYSIDFPNIYGANTSFYGEGVVVNGRFSAGF